MIRVLHLHREVTLVDPSLFLFTQKKKKKWQRKMFLFWVALFPVVNDLCEWGMNNRKM